MFESTKTLSTSLSYGRVALVVLAWSVFFILKVPRAIFDIYLATCLISYKIVD